MVLVGRWWKFTYDQIRDNSRTKAQSAKTFKKGISWFLFKIIFAYFVIFVCFRNYHYCRCRCGGTVWSGDSRGKSGSEKQP